MNDTKKLDHKAEELVDKWIERYRRGSLRFFILHFLLYKHRHKDTNSLGTSSFHGYKLAQKVEEVTQGKWKPTTASIYPILKELYEAEVIEKIPGVEQQETGRTTIEYKLTPFGLKTAQKLEEARKEFAKAFIEGKKGHLPPLLFPLGSNISQEEAKKIFLKAPDEVLCSHRDHIKGKMEHIHKHLEYIEEELDRRKKEEKKE